MILFSVNCCCLYSVPFALAILSLTVPKRVYNGYLRMFRDPVECARYCRNVEGPVKARIFKISDLIKIQETSRRNPNGYNLRSWTYILLSCSLFLRKSEAAALSLSDIEMPMNPVTGEVITEHGLPKYIYVHVRRSKTDQRSEGSLNVSTCTVAILILVSPDR